MTFNAFISEDFLHLRKPVIINIQTGRSREIKSTAGLLLDFVRHLLGQYPIKVHTLSEQPLVVSDSPQSYKMNKIEKKRLTRGSLTLSESVQQEFVSDNFGMKEELLGVFIPSKHQRLKLRDIQREKDNNTIFIIHPLLKGT